MRAAVVSTPNPNADLAIQKLIDELSSSTSLTCELLSQIRQFQELNTYNLKVKKIQIQCRTAGLWPHAKESPAKSRSGGNIG